MKKSILILLSVIAVLVVIKLTLLKKEDSPQTGGNGNNKKSAPLGISVLVLKPEKTEQQLFASGTILASEEVDLHTEMAGKIIRLDINEGNAVSKGDLLIKLNDSELQAQLKKYRSQEKLALDQVKRLKTLLAVNGISQEEYESSQNQLNNIQSDIEFTQAQLAKTEIRAPFNGVIGLRSVSEGSYITSATRIASLSQLDPVRIDFTIPERYASLVRKNSTIRFTAEGQQQSLEARIAAIEPRVDVATRTVQVRAVCPNKSRKFFPGAFAKISIVLNESDSTLMVPTEALVPVLKGYKVFVKKKGLAEEIMVVTGLRTEKKVQVLQGLSPGDSLITSGIMQLKKDMPVIVKGLK